MKQISLLIKPASGLCNMRCRYCFYADVSARRAVGNRGIMTKETAQQLICSAVEYVGSHGQISFAFQGGEPTMAGQDFFRAFIALETAYIPPTIQISHAIQTNGFNIDEEWVDFLQENRFLVGLSLDGLKELHDFYRVDTQNQGTWSRVVKTLTLLQKKQVPCNLLCVVTAQCARKPQKIYRTLKRLGGEFLQFIPCLDPLAEARGEAGYSLLP